MDTLVVTGIDSVTGGNLAQALAEHCDVIGVAWHSPVQIDGVDVVTCGSRNLNQMLSMVADLRPQWILHCGALSVPSWDLPSLSIDSEYELNLAIQLAGVAALSGSLFTLLSTDGVFAGPRMFHEEDSPVAGGNRATSDALRIERRVLELPDTLVVRSHPYGWSPGGSQAGYAETIWQALSTGRSLPLDGKRYATPILTTDLAEMLLRAYELRLQGLYHIAGAERTSPYRFARELAAVLGLQLPQVESDSRGSMKQVDALEETSLNSRRARRALERPMPLLREGLQRFAEQLQNGWRERLLAADRQYRGQAA